MKTVIHRAGSRGHNQLNWLDSYHSFSFGHFFDEEKIHFGALRVLNDDTVMPGMGFGTHPHDNMEIVSIPLEGSLEHRDSMGNHGIIKSGDIQIMSAGTGIMHSEFNHSGAEMVKFLQIWIFPRERQIAPRYDQKTLNPEERQNRWQILVDPHGIVGVLIVQEAWFSMTELEKGFAIEYDVKRQGNGMYFFVIEGSLNIGGETLTRRDAMGVWDTGKIEVTSNEDHTLVLAIEVPMDL